MQFRACRASEDAETLYFAAVLACVRPLPKDNSIDFSDLHLQMVHRMIAFLSD